MPEGVAGRAQTGFTPPERVPFSEHGQEFIEEWGRTDEGDFEGEHLEGTGQSGSGKSYALATLLHMRALIRDSATVLIATKIDDKTLSRLAPLGWPIVNTAADVRRHRQCIFWPDPQGDPIQRKKKLEQAIWDLLNLLWVKESNTVVVFDEIGTVEGLSGRLREFVRQYWREGRALGISVVAFKQRPVGVVRDQHSETRWKIVFPPADMGDMKRFAELLGQPKHWQPILEGLDQENHEFVMRNNVSKRAYITWIDFPLEDLPPLPDREEHPVYGTRPAA